MIDYWQALALAFIQGLTEFLPISSSAHLVLPTLLLGWQDQGLAFDVAVHVGTLLAVLVYYRQDLLILVSAWFSSITGGASSEHSRLAWMLVIATVPAGLVGFFGDELIERHLRSLMVITATTIIFGLLLGLAELRARRMQQTRPVSFNLALCVGLAQALAPVPGVSRSGVTMTAALLLGLSRQAAARFSFLLSIPIIASAGGLKTFQLFGHSAQVNWLMLAASALMAAVTAYACIAVFLKLLDRVGLMPFVWYRLLLGVVLAVIAISSVP